MTNLILFVFATVGLCAILVESTLFAPVRNWICEHKHIRFFNFLHEILSCYQCSGMYCGLFCSSILLVNSFTIHNLLIILMGGFAGSFLSSFTANFLTYLLAKSVVDIPEEEQKSITHDPKGSGLVAN
jgi:hypothetical protein